MSAPHGKSNQNEYDSKELNNGQNLYLDENSKDFNPRESQTNYNKTRLPHIRSEPKELVLSPESRAFIGNKNHERFLSPQSDVYQHVISPSEIEYFKDNRYSVNIENGEYKKMKQTMQEEVRESINVCEAKQPRILDFSKCI